MKLVVIFNVQNWSGRLTKFWTGCHAFHCGWTDGVNFWDMHLIRRRRMWPGYTADQVLLFDFPNVTREYLETQLSTDDNIYGWRDYLLFALRPLYHLLGKSTPNAGGMICSEMIANDLNACLVTTPWKFADAPPSPCDLYNWAKQI